MLQTEIINIKPIGIIHSPFIKSEGTPIQPRGAIGVKGKIEIFEEYKEGLQDIEGFSHIIIIYYFHKITETSLIVKPYLDDREHGVFAVRSPKRPNKIGFSVVKLIEVQNNFLLIENVDILNETPVIDIKPYIPDFDIFAVDKIGWLNNKSQNCKNTRDDGRFTDV